MKTKNGGEPRAIVIGAGVAGLTAAHELAERGFKVDVYERALFPGGKAATRYPTLKLHPGVESNKDWIRVPSEHGFRLFPSFYRHVIDTMHRIPFDPSKPFQNGQRREGKPLPDARTYHTVGDNLIATRIAAMARHGIPPRPIPRAGAGSLDGFLRLLEGLTESMRVDRYATTDAARLQLKMLQYLTSCKKRRDEPGSRGQGYGERTWWDFLGGHRFSEDFQSEIETFVRTMVAMEARTGNCRTVGNVAMQLAFDMSGDGTRVDRLLNGPTSDQWLLPWEEYLRRLEVTFNYGKRVSKLEYSTVERRITGIQIHDVDYTDGVDNPKLVDVGADCYVVAALPLDEMQRLLSKRWAQALVADDPGLTWIRDVDLSVYTSWMAGIQFYLEDEDVSIIRGHVYYPESAWKLSSVSQAQFWGPDFCKRYGDDKIRGILSVDVCDWQTREGQHKVRGRTAEECPWASMVADEVWAQLQHALTVDGRCLLPRRYAAYHVDDSIVFPHVAQKGKREDLPDDWERPDRVRYRAINTSPYLVHPAGSHRLRPTAETCIENLVLASDYVRSNTDLATMEGANEAARRAVNAVLRRMSRYNSEGCALFDYEEPAEFNFIKRLDEDLFLRGEPHLFEVLGLLEQFERASSASTSRGVVSVAASSVKGAQAVAGGVSDFIARVF